MKKERKTEKDVGGPFMPLVSRSAAMLVWAGASRNKPNSSQCPRSMEETEHSSAKATVAKQLELVEQAECTPVGLWTAGTPVKVMSFP